MSQHNQPPTPEQPQQPWWTGNVPPPAQHAAPPPAPKKARRWPWIVGIVAALFVGYGTGSAGDPETTAVANPAPTATVEVPGPTETVEVEVPVPGPTVTVKPVAPKPAPKPKPAEPKVSFPGDGMYLVGTDIKPGRYKTTGSAGIGCYWERLSGTSGEFDDIIANENLEGPGFVTIKKSDEAFSTNGCEDWVRVN